MTETKTQETNRTVQTQPIAIKMHYICESDDGSKINKYAAILIAVMYLPVHIPARALAILPYT